MTTGARGGAKRSRLIFAAAVWLALPADAALAQSPGPNPGALTVSAGVEVASVYVFRGLGQEADPKLTLWPQGEIGLSVFSGAGALRKLRVDLGVWNSLQTGSSGSDGPSARVHYAEYFHTTLSLGFAGGVGVGTTFTAYTSPNGMFNTVKEVSLNVARADMVNPYGLVAFELGDDGQADAGRHKGTYLELGVGPSFRLMADGPTLTIPVKVGASLKDYYEAGGIDSTFGFFDVGAQLTIPLKGVPDRFGSWNVHGGANLLLLGDTTKLFNDGDTSKLVGVFGIGLTY